MDLSINGQNFQNVRMGLGKREDEIWLHALMDWWHAFGGMTMWVIPHCLVCHGIKVA